MEKLPLQIQFAIFILAFAAGAILVPSILLLAINKKKLRIYCSQIDSNEEIKQLSFFRIFFEPILVGWIFDDSIDVDLYKSNKHFNILLDLKKNIKTYSKLIKISGILLFAIVILIILIDVMNY